MGNHNMLWLLLLGPTLASYRHVPMARILIFVSSLCRSLIESLIPGNVRFHLSGLKWLVPLLLLRVANVDSKELWLTLARLYLVR